MKLILILGLSALAGCATLPSPVPQRTDSELNVLVQEHLRGYHQFLLSNRLLLRQMGLYDPDNRWGPYEVDPDTRERIVPPTPTREEVIENLTELLKDPVFRKQWLKKEIVKMPAGSPSPAFTPPAGSRDPT